MKKIYLIIVLFFYLINSCSNNFSDNNKYANGQIKSSIHKSIDENKTYYEITYDSLGRIKSIATYSNELLEGTKVIFRLSNLEVGALVPYKNGKRNGFTYEFIDGQQTMFKGKSVNDLFEGESTWFFEDGKIAETGIRINDKKEGLWKEYYKNGILKCQGTYKNNEQQNDWIYFDENGQQKK